MVFEIFKSALSPMLTLFICIIIGYILNKSKKAPKNTATVLSVCENYFIVPALLLNNFTKYCNIESLKNNYRLVLYSGMIVIASVIIAILLSRLFSKETYTKNMYKYALAVGNYGYVGNMEEVKCKIAFAILF